MYKIVIAAVAASALMVTVADAASRTVRPDGQAIRDAASAQASAAPVRDGWDGRSVFYQGPTYVGRY